MDPPENLHVLYAEDNPMDADLVRARVAEELPTARVEIVASGTVCLERLAKEPFDVLLLDNHLTDLDGIEVLTELNKTGIEVPIVMVTGTGDEEIVVQSLRLGAIDYLPKGDRWLDEIAGVLSGARQRFLGLRETGRLARKARRIGYAEHVTSDVDLTVAHFADHARHLTVVPIATAEEAIEIFAKPNDLDLLLIDLRMPSMNALEVIREIGLRAELPPIIVVSGKGDDAAAIAALRLGAFDYIPKHEGYLLQLPYTIDHAIDRRQLEQSRARLERELARRETVERALRVSESRFRRLWESGIIGILLTTPDGRILEANDAFARMLGYDQDDVRSGRLGTEVLMAPEYHASHKHALASLRATGGAPPRETVCVHADGHRVPAMVGLTRLEGVDDTVLGYVLDMTELHGLRAQLMETQRLEALGRLAGGVAHDINNLLTVAALGLEAAKSKGADATNLGMVSDAIAGASQITHELLAFGRRESLVLEPVDMAVLVRRLFAGVLRTIGEHIRVTLVIPDEPFIVRGNETALERVVVNLVGNARDAMSRGGELRVTLDHEPIGQELLPANETDAGDWVCLSVEDTGEGIAEELLPHVFEPFVTTRSSGRGTGLGLASVHGIVKNHGGAVSLSSTRGVGTVARVYLPSDQEGTVAARKKEEAGALEPVRILLVEDDALVRRVTAATLVAAGHEVVEAADGASAERALFGSQEPFDVVVMDNMMPGGRVGVDVLARLRERAPDLAAVLMSGVDAPVSKQDVFLPKPFTGAELESAIAEARRRVAPKKAE